MNEDFISSELKKYNVSDAKIAELKDQYIGVIVKDPQDKDSYSLCKAGHQIVKSLRLEIEKKRVELKASSLSFGRAVDGEAKRLTGEIKEIEDHLYSQRKVVEDEAERKRKEKEEAIKAEEERKRKEEEDRLEAIRLEQERKFAEERDRLEKIRKEQEAREAKIKADQDSKDEEIRKAQEKIRKEQEAIEKEKEKIEKEKEDKRLAEIRAKDLEIAKKKAAEKALEDERLRVLAEKEEAKRLEELKPDIAKIKLLAKEISSIVLPSVKSKKANAIIIEAGDALSEISDKLLRSKL